MAIKKFLDNDGLLYFWTKLKTYFVKQESGKGLSSNDLTDTLKSHYDTAYTHSQSTHAPSNAERNTIVGVQVNGTDLTINSSTRKVDVTVPTNLSQLTNDEGFITSADAPEGAIASTVTPVMSGVASKGTDNGFARGDHVHPSDTSKVDKIDGKGLSTNDYTTAEKNKLAGIAAGAEVNVNADWNATSGDSKILNKPTLGTMASETATNYIKKTDAAGYDDILTATTAASTYVAKNGTDRLMTVAEGTKLAGIDEGAEVNVIETIKVNGTAQTVTSKAVNITVPTNNNQLTNGAGYQTSTEVENAITAKGYQTSTEVENAITAKGYQTSTEVENAITAKGYQTSAQVESAIIGKGYQTAAQVDSIIINKGYATTSEVTVAIANAGHLKRTKVDSLPAVSSADPNTIYMLPIADATGNNKFTEWMVIDDAWEKTGSSDVDLTGYVEDSDLAAITNAEIDTICAT